MGAIAEGGVVIRNQEVIDIAGVTEEAFAAALESAGEELAAKIGVYRGDVSPLGFAERTVIVVDDGLATGSTALAAVAVARERAAGSVWVAVPVAPRQTAEILEAAADRVVVLHQPRRFLAVGAWYYDFTQTTDAEVRDLLKRSRAN